MKVCEFIVLKIKVFNFFKDFFFLKYLKEYFGTLVDKYLIFLSRVNKLLRRGKTNRI